MKTIDIKRLRALLSYDRTTGVFCWKTKRVGSRVGDVAGSNAPGGYRKITLDGQSFFEHRLVWAHVHGVWPESQIDHINGVTNDNRLSNLRLATQNENKQNQRRAMKNNSSGLLGVSIDASRQQWKASIAVNKRRIYLGRYDSPQSAHKAYLVAKARFHPTASINTEGNTHVQTQTD